MEPLETEVLKEWQQDGAVCRLVRYQVGVFKGAPEKVDHRKAFNDAIGKSLEQEEADRERD
ncbi:MAG: hypothetical protein ABIP85_20360 [Chthoniobacteraceae bacterium]